MTRIIRKVRDAGLFLALIFLGALIAARLEDSAAVSISGPFVAVDGDTLAAGAERLRLEGLDAPEARQTCEDGSGRNWRCGEEARATLERLTSAASVVCSGSERDRYGRLLVRCRNGGLDINAELVKAGMAVASGDYSSEEAEARSGGEGLWTGEFERPRDWRVRHGMMDDPSAAEGFLAWLKGWFGRN
ncbi:succinoglycan biosynthesis protein [Pseudorhizobium endolithicum]|uniref:Succinoglycan biosynthesis protein n=1 Tax=Pseudorhizobium endolithicum TaxID=1191678 RepID=A0ABN7JXK0_9HYPH|nr:thermonuclease family protein [Pseudorhizobium endolithicum]CAD7045638.1 succinoglycan biosynthesis protein [Pseudorhizobium endolithicum]